MTTALIIFAFCTPILACFSFLFGLKVGKKEDIKIEIKRKPKPHAESEEARKQRIISANIENYGTNRKQVEIK